eukprot:UN27311
MYQLGNKRENSFVLPVIVHFFRGDQDGITLYQWYLLLLNKKPRFNNNPNSKS